MNSNTEVDLANIDLRIRILGEQKFRRRSCKAQAHCPLALQCPLAANRVSPVATSTSSDFSFFIAIHLFFDILLPGQRPRSSIQ
jgi:hypothetical protein